MTIEKACLASQEDELLQTCINETWQEFCRMEGTYKAFAKSSGETYATFMVLTTLGESAEGLSQSDLSSQLTLPKQTVGSIVAGLQSRGLAQRSPSPVDRRKSICRLTEEGRAYYETLEQRMSAVELAAARRVGLEDLEHMQRTLVDFAVFLKEEMAADERRRAGGASSDVGTKA